MPKPQKSSRRKRPSELTEEELKSVAGGIPSEKQGLTEEELEDAAGG